MKLVHTSITVKNMDDSLSFYTKKLGLKLLSRREIPENKAEIAFIGDGTSDHRIELTYWKEKKDYTEGDQLDHLAFTVSDIDKTIIKLRGEGVNIAKEPFYLKGSKNRIVFITDPNNIWIEIIEEEIIKAKAE
jgi:lactoylglutathione lyase